jgi:citrate lyase subunit beta/citryl-CoA lyase
MRSLLIAPGDNEARIAAALQSDADVVAIDLDVARTTRAAARASAGRALKAQDRGRRPALMVRLGALDDGEADDLDAIVGLAPAAVLLPKALGGASVQRLSARLAVREADNAIEHGSTRIIAMIDSAAALLSLASLRGCSARLVGLAWDAAALSADIGAEPPADARAGPCRLARDLTLVAAVAAGVAAIDAGFLGADPEALRAEALQGRRAGFSAKIALNPDQARIINRVFATEG